METTIRTGGIELTTTQRLQLQELLRTALARYERRIAEAAMYLQDVNGPKGGIDRECRIVLTLRPKGQIVVTGTGAEVYPVAKATADRAAFATRRWANRRRSSLRRGTRRLAAAAA